MLKANDMKRWHRV